MSQGIRIILFNADEDYSSSIRTELLAIDGVKVVADIEEAGMLLVAVQQYPCDLVVVNLDPSAEEFLDIAIQIAGTLPDVPVFALSERTDGQLILGAMRGGIREFLTKPFDADQFIRAVDKAILSHPERRPQGKLYSLVGTQGGVGATTLATNLAVEMADLNGGNVALVDFDFRFGQIATLLDLQPTYTIADLCDTVETLDPTQVERAMLKHESGVHVLARPHNFGQADLITAAQGVNVLSTLQELYRHVIVDGPMRYDAGGRNILDMADYSLLVLQLVVTSVRNTNRMLEELRTQGYNIDRLRLVCNRVGEKEKAVLGAGGLGVEHVESTLNMRVFSCVQSDWKAIGSSINMGQPLMKMTPKGRTRLDVREIAEKLLGNEDQMALSSNKKSGGFLSKIFNDA
jgi:pilus assembly protein CpaE